MFKGLLITLFFLSSSTISLASLVLVDGKDFYKVGLYLDILEDKTGLLTINDVKSLKFKKSTSEAPNFGGSKSSFWARLKIENRSTKKKEWLLFSTFYTQDEIIFYRKMGSGWSLSKTGDLYPFSSREVKARPFVFKLNPGKESIYYVRIRGTDNQFSLHLTDVENFSLRESKANYVYGIIFGLFLSMALYNFFISVVTKSLSYLFYVFFTLFMGIFISGLEGFNQIYLFQNYPWFSNSGQGMWNGLGQFFGSLFAFYYLKVKDAGSIYYNIILALCFSSAFVAISSLFLPYSIHLKLWLLHALYIVVVLILCAFKRLRQNYRPAFYFLISWLPLLLGGGLTSMMPLGLVPSNFFTQNAFTIGNAIQFILLSMGLADRFNYQQSIALKKEKRLVSLLDKSMFDLGEKNSELELMNRKMKIKNLQEKEDHRQLKLMFNSLEESKNNLEGKVKERTKELTKVQEERSLFFAKLSHELRTPLNSILGFSNFLLESRENYESDEEEYLKCIKSSGYSLLGLVDEIHDFTKIDLSELKIVKRKMDLEAFIKNISVFYNHQCQQKGLSFLTEIDDKVPNVIIFDELRIKQVLNNMLNNALKFTEKGSLNLKCICNFRDDSPSKLELKFIIQDSGIGIKKENINKLFNTFSQVHESGVIEERGTGLGLYISKKIVDEMNGTILVDSIYGEGTKFELNFQDIEIVETPINEKAKPIKYKFFGDKVLIADDLPINIVLLETYLRDCNLEVLKANNGKEVLKKAKEYRPELIITDYNMPEGDGGNVIDELKKTSITKDIPVILITAFKVEKQMKELFQSILNKPIEKENFLEEISRYLKHSKEDVYDNETESFNFYISGDLGEMEKEIIQKMKNKFGDFIDLQDIVGLEQFCQDVIKNIENNKLKYLRPWFENLFIESSTFQIDKMNEHLQDALEKIDKFLEKD